MACSTRSLSMTLDAYNCIEESSWRRTRIPLCLTMKASERVGEIGRGDVLKRPCEGEKRYSRLGGRGEGESETFSFWRDRLGKDEVSVVLDGRKLDKKTSGM